MVYSASSSDAGIKLRWVGLAPLTRFLTYFASVEGVKLEILSRHGYGYWLFITEVKGAFLRMSES
jgi:hypothetical protein